MNAINETANEKTVKPRRVPTREEEHMLAVALICELSQQLMQEARGGIVDLNYAVQRMEAGLVAVRDFYPIAMQDVFS